MGHNERDPGHESTSESHRLRDLNPWREVGWIFRDGNVVAIARQDERPEARFVVD